MAAIKHTQFEEVSDNLNGDMSDLKHTLAGLHAQTEDYVREKPTQAVLSALGVGFVLRLLPLGAIVGLLVRLLLFLARPALFIYGAVTLYKHFTESRPRD